MGHPGIIFPIAIRALPILAALGVIGLIVGLWGALFVVPPDYQQGDSARIMYIHVPAAWSAMGIYFTIAVAAFITLVFRSPMADVFALTLTPIGMLMSFLVLTTGSIWGKPMWGTWWVWDARLTSVFVLFLLFVGLGILRQIIQPRQRAARISAVVALIGAINLPVIKFSVEWWNTLHQGSSIFRMDGPTIHSDMLWPLFVLGFSFFLILCSAAIVGMKNELMQRRISRILSVRSEEREKSVARSTNQPLETANQS